MTKNKNVSSANLDKVLEDMYTASNLLSKDLLQECEDFLTARLDDHFLYEIRSLFDKSQLIVSFNEVSEQ